ncbi:MAG: M13 family peptidase, partial [Verrucomicrobia bacterium]
MKSSFVIVALLNAFSLQAQSVSPVNQNPPPLDPKNMDTAVKPQDDFYLYANGGWLKRNPVPPEYARWGSFSELEEKNNEALHKIAEKTANAHLDANTAPEVQKVGDYYASGMDEKTIEATRTKPLEDELKRIDSIKDRADLLSAIARLHTIGVAAFFEFGSGQDAKDSTRDIAQAQQGGLGLPDRDYYTKTDEDSKKKRAAYIDHVTKMLTLL